MKRLHVLLMVGVASSDPDERVWNGSGRRRSAFRHQSSRVHSRFHGSQLRTTIIPKHSRQSARPRPSAPSDALTTAEMQGFDVDVAAELGKRLGVETCFATPDWDVITAGNWANKWDLSVGSMTITPDRQKILDFTHAYYYTPAVIAVTTDVGHHVR